MDKVAYCLLMGFNAHTCIIIIIIIIIAMINATITTDAVNNWGVSERKGLLFTTASIVTA